MNIIPIEVRYQRFKQPKISRGMRSFLTIYRPKRALVVTRDLWATYRLDETEVLLAPACYL